MLLWAHAVFAQPKEVRIIPLNSVFILLEQNSTALRLSKTRIETAQSAVSAVRHSRFPSIDIGFSGSYLDDATLMDRDFSHTEKVPISHFGYTFSVEASYLAFDGGAVSNSIANAELETQLATLAHRKNQLDMQFLAAGYYLDLCRLHNQRTVFLKNIEQTELLISQIQAKHKEGMALGNDLTRIELQRENLNLELIEIENSISIINQNLVTTLGLPTETFIETDTALNVHFLMRPENELLQIAQENRPELRIASVHSSIANTRVRLAKSAYFPSISIFAGDRLDGPITSIIPPLDKNINYWHVGVGLNYPLSSLYKSNTTIRTATSAQRAEQYEQTLELEHTKTAIHAAQTKFAESMEKVHTYEKASQLASENYAVVNNRYLNDLALITEMLDASTIKLNAELQVVNANLTVTYSYFKLFREIGKQL